MGVSSVVESELYKPIFNGDNKRVSEIASASNKFFYKIGLGLVVYTIVLMIVYPLMVPNDMGHVSTTMLIFSIALGLFFQYFLGITNEVILNAEQYAYVQYMFTIITTILNTVICIVMIQSGANIITLKFVSSLIFLLRPLGMRIVIVRKFKINFKEHYNEDPIKQKWNGLAQHIASFIFGNTDIAVLTLLSTLKNVSIYSIYSLVVTSLNTFGARSLVGVRTNAGRLYASTDKSKLTSFFEYIEWLYHNIVIVIFADTSVLISSFVAIYTKGVHDANYYQPLFALVISVAYGTNCINNIYNSIIHATGKFKETQHSYIIEAILNISLSIILVFRMGIVGVAIGTLIAVVYQLAYYIRYFHNNIVFISYKNEIKLLLVDCVIFIGIQIIGKLINIDGTTYLQWIPKAIITLAISVLISIVINYIFYHDMIIKVRTSLKR